MRLAQILVAPALAIAVGVAMLPREAAMTTGSIAGATAPASGDALSCDQALYQEELELLTGLNCG
jgi:hypothetical protein